MWMMPSSFEATTRVTSWPRHAAGEPRKRGVGARRGRIGHHLEPEGSLLDMAVDRRGDPAHDVLALAFAPKGGAQHVALRNLEVHSAVGDLGAAGTDGDERAAIGIELPIEGHDQL